MESREQISFHSTFISKIVELVASTNLGQFAIKKLDSLLWILERPAKYCMSVTDGRDANRELSWLVFWIILINLELFRTIVSKILVQFNKNPIESEDIVSILQKWRRTLRSIRFRGLQDNGLPTENEIRNGNGDAESSPTLMQSDKIEPNNDKIVDYDLLEELMNRTFSDNDLDSTFTIGRSCDTSMFNCSSNGQSFTEDYQSPLSDSNSMLNNTLPILSDSEELEGLLSTSKELNFELTVESAFTVTREGSTSSLTEESRTKFESNGKLSIESSISDQCGSIPNSINEL